MAYKKDLLTSEKAVRCCVFLLALLLIGFVCAPYVQAPPVWDAASGVFAPAIFLYEDQGNLVELLQKPGFLLGGPNIHSMSLYTGLVYLSMCIFEGRPDYYLGFLHVFSIVAASLIILVFFSSLRLGFNREKSFLGALVLVSYPLFLVQSSYIYTEIPGSLFALLSSYLWAKKNYFTAAVMVLSALLIKTLGLFCVAAFLMLLLVDYLFSGEGRRSLRCFSFVLLASSVVMLVRLKFSTTPQGRSGYLEYIQSVLSYLSNVPDLIIFLLSVPLALSVVFLKSRPLGVIGASKDMLSSSRGRLIIASIAYSCAFISLILTISLSGKNFFPLPRYYIWVLPSLLVCFIYLLDVFMGRYSQNASRVLLVVSISLVVVLFSINREGALYPHRDQRISSFSIVERSFEYNNFWQVQRSAIKYVDEKYHNLPVFVTRGEYYYMSSPLTGYVRNEFEKLHFVLSGAKEVSLPSRFVIIDAGSNAFHGQTVINSILKVAASRAGLSLKLVNISEHGEYYSRVFLVSSVVESKTGYTNNSSNKL